MKILLLGSTGFIGSEVLTQCLSHPSITTIIALSRRALPITHEKLTTIILSDFTSYPASVLEQMRGAEACIWSIGTYTWDPLIELTYPTIFQTALLSLLPPSTSAQQNPRFKFKYIYLGGAFTEPNQDKTLWFFSKGRHIRGQAQTSHLRFSSENETKDIQLSIVRPAGVLAGDGNRFVEFFLPTVSLRRLAGVMVDLAIRGREGGSGELVENKEIIERGEILLAKRGEGL